MSHCHEEPPSPGACHQQPSSDKPEGSCENTGSPAPADSCCEQPQKRDYLLIVSCSIVGIAYLLALVMGHDHSTAVGVFTGAIFELFNRMWWGIALGMVFVGILARIPRELVMEVLGRERGLPSLLRATLAGVLLDLCSHGILAVGMKLYERGASTGQVMAFLLSSPWNSFSLTLILIGLIGLKWTLLFIALSMLVGLVTGAIFDRLVAVGRLPDNPWREQLGERRPLAQLWPEFRQTIRVSATGSAGILRDGLAGSQVVIRWAMFGLVLAATIRALVPAEAFAVWFGATMGGLWLTLLATTVIEVCSEGSSPIAADLMNRANAPGNSFTFLMAGVATDYTEVMSIRDTTRSWKIALALPLIAVPQVMVLGFLLNQL
jgi:uncharacterized protein